MESSTEFEQMPETKLDGPQAVLFEQWEQVERKMPFDLEESAQQAQVLRRKRGIKSASDYLRLALMYGVSEFSLRLMAAWALVQGIGNLSDVAVLNRLRACTPWLALLIGQILQQRFRGLQELPGMQIRLQDASAISRPGSKGTDWRLHLTVNLWPLRIDGIEVTDEHTGENLNLFEPRANEIRVADRGYAYASNLGPLLAQEVQVVIRANWHNLRLETADGQRIGVIAWLKKLTGPGEQTVYLPTPQCRFPLRLLASPLPPEEAQQARERTRKRNGKKGRKVSPESLLAAGFLLVLTNLPSAEWSLAHVCGLYRLRWQIELLFKRLKSLLDLDQLRAKDPQLAQAYLLSKLLAALLIDELIEQVAQQQPEWFISLERPVSLWRLTQWFWESVRQAIIGRLNRARFVELLPALRRYFCDSPRARPQQLAWARALLDFKSGSLSFFSC